MGTWLFVVFHHLQCTGAPQAHGLVEVHLFHDHYSIVLWYLLFHCSQVMEHADQFAVVAARAATIAKQGGLHH
jgi:hypothetical protein